MSPLNRCVVLALIGLTGCGAAREGDDYPLLWPRAQIVAQADPAAERDAAAAGAALAAQAEELRLRAAELRDTPL